MDFIGDCSSSSKPRKWKWFKNEKDKECDKIETLASSIVKMSDIIDQMDKKTVVAEMSKENEAELNGKPDLTGNPTNCEEVSSNMKYKNVEMFEVSSEGKETSPKSNVHENLESGLDAPVASHMEQVVVVGESVEETFENGDDIVSHISEKVEKLNVNDCEEVSDGLSNSLYTDKCSLCRQEQVHECEQVEEHLEDEKPNNDNNSPPKEDCPPELVSLMKELLSKYKAGSESQTNVSMEADVVTSKSATSESDKISEDEIVGLPDNSASLDQDCDLLDPVTVKVDIQSDFNMTQPMDNKIGHDARDCTKDTVPDYSAGLDTISTESQGNDNGLLDDSSLCLTDIGSVHSIIHTEETKYVELSSQQDATKSDNKESVKDMCHVSAPQDGPCLPEVTLLQDNTVEKRDIKEQDDCSSKDLSLDQQQTGSEDTVFEKLDSRKEDELTAQEIESQIDDSKSVKCSQQLDKIEEKKAPPYSLGKDRLELYLDFVKLWCEVNQTGEANQVKKEANILWKEKLQNCDSVSVPDYMEQMSILRSRLRQQKYGDSLPDCLDVEFVCSGSESCVKVGGSFNDWIPESLTENSSGEWTGAFTLAPGDYLYKYVVEGEWVVDPTKEVVIDDAGIENNRIVVEDRITKCLREILESRANISTELSLPWKSAPALELCPK